MNKKIITISGSIGSGKSTICEHLKSRLKWEYLDIGRFTRKLGKERNMSIDEFASFMNSHPEIDDEIDNFTIDQAKTQENLIFSSRIAWHLIPGSFKIFLYCPNEVAAQRVFNDPNRVLTEHYDSLDDAIEKINSRNVKTQARLQAKYNVDIFDSNNYDLYIDTSTMTIDEVLDIIIKSLGDIL